MRALLPCQAPNCSPLIPGTAIFDEKHRRPMGHTMKVCILGDAGGHMTELLSVAEAFDGERRRFYVTGRDLYTDHLELFRIHHEYLKSQFVQKDKNFC